MLAGVISIHYPALVDVANYISGKMSDQEMLLTVRRGSVLESAIKCTKRSIFSPTKLLKVSEL